MALQSFLSRPEEKHFPLATQKKAYDWYKHSPSFA
jgi:hypothetical protein